MNGFPVVLTIPILWGDHDAFGHVNNTVYLRWCETARVAYMERAGMWPDLPPSGVGPILASITCDYRLPLTYPDTVRVGARVTRIGRSSFRMEHVIFSEAAQKVAAEIVSTMVLLDYAAGKPTPVAPDARRAIEVLEGRALEE